jgi:hypothetical protein
METIAQSIQWLSNGPGIRENVVRLPAGTGNFPLLQSIHTGSEAQLANYWGRFFQEKSAQDVKLAPRLIMSWGQ